MTVPLSRRHHGVVQLGQGLGKLCDVGGGVGGRVRCKNCTERVYIADVVSLSLTLRDRRWADLRVAVLYVCVHNMYKPQKGPCT